VRFVEKYGDELVCVRYRYDAVNTRKVKTVELIVEKGIWEPTARPIPPVKRSWPEGLQLRS
jgi:hypothetical protein